MRELWCCGVIVQGLEQGSKIKETLCVTLSGSSTPIMGGINSGQNKARIKDSTISDRERGRGRGQNRKQSYFSHIYSMSCVCGISAILYFFDKKFVLIPKKKGKKRKKETDGFS